ncbi:hypothetical protein ACFPM3_15630 [Streptomyces coeruleoprunus]|uniref:Uncharacterized protein n=1 Tax=Streptomyces coeruleoprunus TaxID=285563 RepID=A0ABV9XFU0_9ACTN
MRILPADDPLGGLRACLEADEAVTGHEPSGFPDHCWLLHAAHDAHGTRVRWSELLAPYGRTPADWGHNLSYRILSELPDRPTGFTWPEMGTPDRETLRHLVDVLARHSPQGAATPCFWVQAWIEDVGEPVTARLGRLDEALAHHDLCEDPGHAPYHFPAQWWPDGRAWYVLTDWDLSATEVFGSPELIAELLGHPWLEAVRHPTIAAVGDAPVGWRDYRAWRAARPGRAVVATRPARSRCG